MGIVAVEVLPDHVHLFVKPDQTASPAYVANQFKGVTSRVLRQDIDSQYERLWRRTRADRG